MNIEDRCTANTEEKNISATIKNVKKSEYLKTLIKLKQQQYILEKGLVDVIDNMKVDAEIIKSLSKEERELSVERDNVLSALNKTVFDIDNDLKITKSIVNDPEKIQSLDIDEFKSKLIGLSTRFDDFKKTYPLKMLIEEENRLDSEIKEIALRLERYETLNMEIKVPMVDVSSFDNEKKKESVDYEEVQDFHALIAKTGHTQNWSNKDHLFFLKMRKKCKNIPALVHAVQTKCPDMSAETIINHEAWYKLYVDLREKQKSKIKEWRKRKEMNNAKQLQNEETLKENLDDNIPISNPEKRAIVKTTETLSVNVNPNANKKELIKKWKLEKESKRAIDEEQFKLRLELKRACEKKRTKIRMQKIQETLQDYRDKKLIEESLTKSKKELKSTKKYDPKLIKEFKKQDEEYLRKRKALLSRTSKVNKLTIARKLKNNSNSSTVCKPTKAWNGKCKFEDSKTMSNKELRYIKDIPQLSTRWRNEESEDSSQSYFTLQARSYKYMLRDMNYSK